MNENEEHSCRRCGEPIDPADLVVMAKQIDVTTMTAVQRQYEDGLKMTYHASCAPRSQVGVLRRVA